LVSKSVLRDKFKDVDFIKSQHVLSFQQRPRQIFILLLVSAEA